MVRKEKYHKAKVDNNKPILHCRFGKNKPWVDITHTRFDVEKLKFIDTNDKEHKYLSCKSELIGLVFKIFLSFLCKQILYDNVVVWTFKYYFWSGHPLRLDLDLVENLFYLNFHNNHKVQMYFIPKLESPVNGDDEKPNIPENWCNNLNINEKNLKIMVVVFNDKNVDEIFYDVHKVWDRQPEENYPLKYISNEETMEFVVIFEHNFIVNKLFNGKFITESQEINNELRNVINSLEITNTLE
uniref:SfiI-subtelomeric related protein family member, putative n=1 Tax=Theileria annulata TaxID=5874 RepID=A0A3B0MNJ0_THEAN